MKTSTWIVIGVIAILGIFFLFKQTPLLSVSGGGTFANCQADVQNAKTEGFQCVTNCTLCTQVVADCLSSCYGVSGAGNIYLGTYVIFTNLGSCDSMVNSGEICKYNCLKTLIPCNTGADSIPCDGVVKKVELLNYLQQYIGGSISKQNILNALQAWVVGGGQS